MPRKGFDSVCLFTRWFISADMCVPEGAVEVGEQHEEVGSLPLLLEPGHQAWIVSHLQVLSKGAAAMLLTAWYMPELLRHPASPFPSSFPPSLSLRQCLR